MKKIFILLLLINFLTPTFASFPIEEKNTLNKKTIQLTKNNDSQLLGNLSLIFGGSCYIFNWRCCGFTIFVSACNCSWNYVFKY